jgi:hypothetical protein
MRLKDRCFDTTEMTGAESQAVLNILQNMTSRMLLKNGRSAGNGAYAQKGSASKVMVASRHRVSF